MGKRVGILGGTFNPIHNGHIKLAEAAYREYELDFVLFMPSGVSYLKNGTGVLDSSIRCRMTELAIEDTEYFILDDREVKRPGNSYTCDTITELRSENPEDELFYITGADTLFSIKKWKDIDVIFSGCTMLVAIRDDACIEEMERAADELRSEYGARIEFLKAPRYDLSSTDIRTYCSKHVSITGLVPEGVLEYIISNGLYGI